MTSDVDSNNQGFAGDVREFWMTYGYVEPSTIPMLMNMVKVWDVSTMAYYRFTSAKKVYVLKD